MARIAFVGGTGPEGLGLALRFALAGEEVVLGSRDPGRAEQAAQELRRRAAPYRPDASIDGTSNGTAVSGADLVALTLPFAAVESQLRDLGPALQGKTILDVVNPLTRQEGLFRLLPIATGSAAEHIQQLVPGVPVVSGFKNLSAKQLLAIEQPLRGDVLLCSDVAAATSFFSELIRRIPHLRPVDAGTLGNARHLESVSALLLNLNTRYRAVTSIEILGLDR